MLAGDIIKNLASGDDQAIEKAKVKADKYIQKLGGTGGDLVTVNQNKNVVNTRPAGISFWLTSRAMFSKIQYSFANRFLMLLVDGMPGNGQQTPTDRGMQHFKT